MDRYECIAGRLTFRVFAKDAPDDLFGNAFFQLRQKAKDLKEKWSQEARESLQNSLINDLKSKGVDVQSVEISLGKYKGSRFVTSAKVRVVVKSEKQAKELEKYLQKYSPKYIFKGIADGVAEFNIR
jgi:hypothetical protein